MAVRLDYVLKETGSNLVRNLTLTLASLLTVAIALAFVAVSFLIGTGINQSFLGLRSDVQMFVYMNPTASEEQIDSVRTQPRREPAGRRGRLPRRGRHLRGVPAALRGPAGLRARPSSPRSYPRASG